MIIHLLTDCLVTLHRPRYQANNCPICRAPFRALLQIRALAKSGHSATHPALAAEAQTEGVPPGYELVNLVESLNGPVTVAQQAVTLTSETQQESEAGRSKKKNRRRGSKDKERRVSSSAVPVPTAPPPVEEPLSVLSPQLTLSSASQRKESITIDIDGGETSSDPLHLLQEELEAQDQEPEQEQEPEATTEDELLEKVNLTETKETRVTRREEEEEDGEEDESCSVSLRGSRKQIQSLPPTPSLPRSSNSTRSSSHQSEESVSSSKHLLSTSNSPKVEPVILHQVYSFNPNIPGETFLQQSRGLSSSHGLESSG